jgi:hypothetical protein
MSRCWNFPDDPAVNYALEPWHDFAVTVGGLAGALTGLLFVALSIKSAALVAPQPRPGIAVELLVLAAISGTALLLLDRRAGHDSANIVARYIEAASPNMITSVLTGIAGLTLLLHGGGGLYWLIPAVLAGLVGGVINAWLFLLRLPSMAQAPGQVSDSSRADDSGTT